MNQEHTYQAERPNKRCKRANTKAAAALFSKRLDDMLKNRKPVLDVSEKENIDYLAFNNPDKSERERMSDQEDNVYFEDSETIDYKEEEDVFNTVNPDDGINITQEEESEYTVRDVFVPSNAFSRIQEYSIRLVNICEENNICREGHRALVSMINEMMKDSTLDKNSKVLSREACDTLVKQTEPL
ncbi:hypothetical protein BD770DRAFT_468531 [Pilaira anomala]|nr:hypothetical protein BD770DRAFT_468531 [Pilaira anomala]